MKRRIIVGAAAMLAITAFTHRQASAAPAPERVCILFEDDSFMCGSTSTDAGYLDLHRPYIVGCIPQGLCDSPDGVRGEAIDGAYENNLYSEAVCPTGCQHGAYAPK